ncbi:hypothetical protein L195_g054818, partial [Trifolium pratense]
QTSEARKLLLVASHKVLPQRIRVASVPASVCQNLFCGGIRDPKRLCSWRELLYYWMEDKPLSWTCFVIGRFVVVLLAPLVL